MHGRQAPATHCCVSGHGPSKQVSRHSPSMQIRESPHSKLNWQLNGSGSAGGEGAGPGSGPVPARGRRIVGGILERVEAETVRIAGGAERAVVAGPHTGPRSRAVRTHLVDGAVGLGRGTSRDSGGGCALHSSPRQRKHPRSLIGPSEMQK